MSCPVVKLPRTQNRRNGDGLSGAPQHQSIGTLSIPLQTAKVMEGSYSKLVNDAFSPLPQGHRKLAHLTMLQSRKSLSKRANALTHRGITISLKETFLRSVQSLATARVARPPLKLLLIFHP